MQRNRRPALLPIAVILATMVARPASAQFDSLLRGLMQQAAPPQPTPYYPQPRPSLPSPPSTAAIDPPRSAGRAGFATGDKFCTDRNATTFLARRAGANLEFSLSTFNGRGHAFSVTGLGRPAGSGWLFQQNMASRNPNARCEARIEQQQDGGYAFWLTPAGPCAEDQGFSPQPGNKFLFPARSRRGGIPAGKTMQDASSMDASGEWCR